MRILDATCGAKSIWYQKNHPFVTYMDKRSGTISTRGVAGKIKDSRTWKIEPDIVGDFTATQFQDDYFDMVVFDPPHIICKKKTKQQYMKVMYGFILEKDYRRILGNGIKELFRVLKPEGVFILKWSGGSKKVEEILKLFPYPPMFGTRTGQANNTHWILFIKYNPNQRLEEL